jgi:hypothetical protein
MTRRAQDRRLRRVWLTLGAFAVTPLAMAESSANVSGAPSPAGALPPADRAPPLAEALTGEPKQDYEAALLLYNSGDFVGAERRFSRAYAATRDVRLLWNAAACEQGLRHYAKAIALVRRYLSSRSPLITEAAESSARAFLDAAIPLTARLVLEVNPSGSSASLDDEPLGALPLEADTRVDFGTHRLLVRKPEFSEHREDFTVTSSADVHVQVTLDPIVHQGRLVVHAGKADSIALDGRFRGLGTFEAAVPSGKHQLRVTAAGSRPFEGSVFVEDERTRTVDVTLEAAPVTSGIPAWIWIAGGAAVLAGAGTAAYFALRPSDASSEGLPAGSAGKVQLPLR